MKKIFIIFLILSLTACATGYHKYSFSGGYKDKRLTDNTYLVEFYGNGATSRDRVETFWDMRAHELCPYGYSVLSNEDGANNAAHIGAAGSLIKHPWKKATIQCHQY